VSDLFHKNGKKWQVIRPCLPAGGGCLQYPVALPLAGVYVTFAIRIEHLLNVTVQIAHDANPRQHRGAPVSATTIGASMAGRPLGCVMPCFRQLHEVAGGGKAGDVP